jgi:thiamine-phosphate pyrophosphorylase
MRGLYAILDTDALDRRALDPCAFAEAVLDARPAAVQLRDKASGARRTLALLRSLAPLAARAGVPLFANDRPDLALLARCDGVHVGQDDVPPALVRGLGGALRVGLSTHDEAQLDAALDEPIDYAAIGPVFATTSKERPSPVVGVSRLRALAARARAARPDLPLVAIGGVTAATAGEVGAIVDAVAVIGALLPEPGEGLEGARDRARRLHEAIVGRGGRAT